LLIASPIILVALIIGLLISILQVITQIQDSTLSFSPKVLAVSFMLIFSQVENLINNKNYLSLVNHIEVQCTVRVGTLNPTIAQLREIKLGQTLLLQKHTDEPVDILFHDKVIARGELMSHEQYFAVQITEVYS
jgi:flagellar motor switch protein FliN